MAAQPYPYGNFANPGTACPETDPRTDKHMLEGLKKFGLNQRTPAAPLDVSNLDIDACVALAREGEKGFDALFQAMCDLLPKEEGEGIAYSRESVKNPDDGYEIVLHVHKPAHHTGGDLPGVAYIHGGGMTILDPYSEGHRRWAHDMARQGLVVINVAFRNAAWDAAAPDSGRKYEAFPTGLNDCVAALRFIHANRQRLGIGKLVLEGESGGGNLVLATMIQLTRDGNRGEIDGVYARVPYISGAYGESEEWKLRHGLNSMVENDGYFLNSSAMVPLVGVYNAYLKDPTDPLAWPWYATAHDVQNFPPTVISVNELDPLRDEGMHFARTLSQAGVHVVSRVNLGMLHASEMWECVCPDHYRYTLEDIRRFAYGLN